MKCKHCGEEMSDFTESFLCCFNDDCPYLRIPQENKISSEGLRAYIHNKAKVKK